MSPATKRKLAPSDSLWGPYLHMLPTPAELTTPLWFTGDEWDMVAGTTLRRMTYRRRDATERSFRALFEERLHRFNGNAFPPAAFSLEVSLRCAASSSTLLCNNNNNITPLPTRPGGGRLA